MKIFTFHDGLWCACVMEVGGSRVWYGLLRFHPTLHVSSVAQHFQGSFLVSLPALD